VLDEDIGSRATRQAVKVAKLANVLPVGKSNSEIVKTGLSLTLPLIVRDLDGIGEGDDI
jgi:hypothetical protein